MRLEPHRARWERRTSELNSKIGDIAKERPFAPELQPLKRKRAYAIARVQKLRADIGPRLDWCGTESLPVRCGCGYVGAHKTCRQWWLCGECRARRAKTLEADIRKGLQLALEREACAWGRDGAKGMAPQLVLLTLTQQHSGNLVDDQGAIADGWRKLYKRMHEEHGSFPYAGVWEVTRGRDGKGHVHLHIVAVWQWRDWGRIREQWLRACPTSTRITFVAARRDGKASSPSSAAKYLGAYLSKGCDIANFSPTLRAEVSAAFYNQRSVISSSHFFSRTKPCCRKCQLNYWLEDMPKPTLAERFPDAVLGQFNGIAIELDFTRGKPPSKPPE